MKDVQMIDIGNPREVAAAAESAVWFHSIDLGHGVVTKGQKTAPALAGELEALRLPGKHLAHRVLGSRAEPVVQDFMLADPQTIGTFDVVLFLGVLYPSMTGVQPGSPPVRYRAMMHAHKS